MIGPGDHLVHYLGLYLKRTIYIITTNSNDNEENFPDIHIKLKIISPKSAMFIILHHPFHKFYSRMLMCPSLCDFLTVYVMDGCLSLVCKELDYIYILKLF
ncbi:UNVERIFIED_CONTAM: hypothetical protein NCL1_60930 [Trichonephila clavipes]